MRRLSLVSSGFAVTFLLYFILGAATEAATFINGAGATFPYPLYSKWFFEYQKKDPEVQMNYQSIGSGGGIRQFTENTVDFGATDSPMTDEQLRKLPSPILHIPTVLGAVVLTYNLPGVATGLKLTPEVIADLFLGKITQWNDPRIQTLNPDAKLPQDSVILVHRSDGSGTTSILTDYLSKVSPDWKSKVGTGTAVQWPVGLGGKGNEGVSGLVKQTPGALGYVELIFAETNHLSYAAVKNSSGQFVLPSVKSVTAAAESSSKNIPDDFRVSITNASGLQAYPMSAFTYLLIHQSMDKEKGEKVTKFLHWAVTDGQKDAAKLYYAPLPSNLAKKVDAKIKTIVLK